MTTRLAGNASHFLPFNKGHEGGRVIRATRKGEAIARLTCGKRF